MNQVGRLGPKVGGHLAPLWTAVHSSNAPYDLSQCSKHDVSIINIILIIMFIIVKLFR